MTDDVKKYLLDILTSIDSINEYIGKPRIYREYLAKKSLRRSVEREIEIIGEAVNRILKIDDTIIITNARQIVNLRNKIIHAYDSIDDALIWSIVINHLPELQKEIKNLFL